MNTTETKYDLFGAAARANPYPIYRDMLANDELVFDKVHGYTQIYAVRHDHVSALLRDPRMIRGNPTNDWTPPEAWKPWFDMTGNWMLFRDPPSHTRLRGLVSTAFTPRAIEQLRGKVEATANALLDRALAKPEFDLIAEYAFEVPVRVIADMLGMPDKDHAQFRAWSHVLAQAIDFNLDDRFMNMASATAAELDAYMRVLIDQKRANPGDDILSSIVHARINDDALTTEEIVGTIALLLFAGHETTVNLIGNGTLALLQHAEQLALLRAQPGLIGNAVEEILRFDGPVQATTRTAGEDMRVGATELKRGWGVTFWLGAANHDPRMFDAPERFDIARKDPKHVTFGGGIHYCIGAPLARMEGQIALDLLVKRAPALRLLDEQPAWRDLKVLRGLASLRVAA